MLNILISYRAAPRIREWETGRLLSDAFRALGHNVYEYGNLYQTGIWLSADATPFNQTFDLHIFCECNDGDRQYAELIDVKCNKRAGWFFDSDMNDRLYERLINYFDFDHVFCANPSFIKSKNNRSWLPYAGDKERHYRSPGWPKKRDICLIGSDRPERRSIIAALRTVGLNAELSYDIFKENYIDAMASSRIIINDPAGGGNSLLPMRYFECPMAGSLLMQADAPMLDHIFIDNQECVIYKNTVDLINKCKSVLTDNELYERIRTNGQNKCLKEHTYINRAMEILSVIS